MSFPHEIFKAYDIRGIVDSSLSLDIVKRIGHALGSEVIAAGGSSIVVGNQLACGYYRCLAQVSYAIR